MPSVTVQKPILTVYRRMWKRETYTLYHGIRIDFPNLAAARDFARANGCSGISLDYDPPKKETS